MFVLTSTGILGRHSPPVGDASRGRPKRNGPAAGPHVANTDWYFCLVPSQPFSANVLGNRVTCVFNMEAAVLHTPWVRA